MSAKIYIQASSLQAPEAEEMKQWADANQKVLVNPAYTPGFFRLKNGPPLWTTKGETSLLVPLFKGTRDVLVRVRGSDATYEIRWDGRFALHLLEETGILPLTEDLIFQNNLFRLRGAAGEEGGEGVAGQEGEGE